MPKETIIIEKLTEEEWKFAERIKSNLEYITRAINGKIFCGIATVIVLLVFLLVIAWGDKQSRPISPAEFWHQLMMSYAFFVVLIGVGVLGAVISHYVYFRRQVEKRKDDLWLLIADEHARSVIHKLLALEEVNEEISKMRTIWDLMDSRKDLFASKIGRQLIAAIQS